jgi:membrane protease YdiL (CAAX protease family)
VLAAVVAPLVEETAFRGLLYTSLRARTGVVASVIISAAIFAAIHPTIPAQFLPIFALGCAFALLREKTGSLAPSMICHGINNAVGLLFVWLIS